MVFIHIISILSFLGNLTISSKDILFHPNPNYFFASPLLTKSNSLSISNSFFHKSFTFSFCLSKFTSFYLKKTIFNFYIQSVILSSDVVVPHYLKCNNQIQGNNKNEKYSIEDCTFDSIGNINSDGAIRIQNAESLFISQCFFLKCKGVDGGGIWAYNVINIIFSKNHFSECKSGVRGSSAFVIMNCNFKISQILVDNCHESSDYQTGIVYIKNSIGTFSHSTFINNTGKIRNPKHYAYVAFESCEDVNATDLCFCYQDIDAGLNFMKILFEKCNYIVQNIVFPSFEYSADNLIITDQSVNKNNNFKYIFNDTQNKICHIDDFIFEEGIVPPTPTQSPKESLSRSPSPSSSQIPIETPTETPIETPTEIPIETPTETPTETPIETPTETPTETPIETPTETPIETPTETPIETPTETPIETPTETPIETPTETPIETPTETPIETPTETPIETPTETPIETPTETPIETPTETPTETPIETPSDSLMETITDCFTETETTQIVPESFNDPTSQEFLPTESFFEISSSEKSEISFTKAESHLLTPSTDFSYDSSLNESESQFPFSFLFETSFISTDHAIHINQNRKPKDYTLPLVGSIIGVIVLIIIIVLIVLIVLHCKNKKREAFCNENTESEVDFEINFNNSRTTPQFNQFA